MREVIAKNNIQTILTEGRAKYRSRSTRNNTNDFR